MKIRSPWMIKTLVLLGFWLLRALIATLSVKYWIRGRAYNPAAARPKERFIYALWHEYLVVPTVEFAHPSCRLLLSQHTDGSVIAEVCKHLRMAVVRGSSSRGGVQAIRQLLKPSRYRGVAITPDGPRGPRRRVSPGIIYLASKLGWPIIPIGVGYQNPWRLRSWDRFAIPKPFKRVDFLTAEPFVVPEGISAEEIEEYRRKLEDVLHQLTEKAEYAATTGKVPDLSPEVPGEPQEAQRRAAA